MGQRTLINARNSQTASPPMTAGLTTPPPPNANPPLACTSNSAAQLTTASRSTSSNQNSQQSLQDSSTAPTCGNAQQPPPTHCSPATATITTFPPCTSMTAATNPPGTCIKLRKSERSDSFPKLRLSPKSFRFSGRFGRRIDPNDPFYHYNKSFQEYDSIGGGPQKAVDKPFLLQDGRVFLWANLDKAWYTHGEDVCVTVNIRNDSHRTVQKVRGYYMMAAIAMACILVLRAMIRYSDNGLILREVLLRGDIYKVYDTAKMENLFWKHRWTGRYTYPLFTGLTPSNEYPKEIIGNWKRSKIDCKGMAINLSTQLQNNIEIPKLTFRKNVKIGVRL